ncbi:bifunctional tetrahydrofolate synthase/dihydrofolate synthase [Halopseudomonas laoshanensis]|uniref:bifunctional tetrahydrofolate synthase/dihydrofolate synthase n=1 Tax=Halopseudomonas laoshanensis TaxID=2268758 RepID=UPI0029346CF6|nr:bifunctional tetrahydrofolate synthase/dihydrofolate synthase [Pseudomonas sp. NyZ704]
MAHTDLAGWLARLEQLHPTEIDMGLQRVASVAARMGLSRPAPLVFTVTGTNGKGSTCATLDVLLQQAGLRTGVYTSPHLLAYNERVCINGKPVSDESLCEAFARIDTARAETSLTYFEFGTLAALLLFEQAGLDAVVLEVGLGGRLDAVNIVDADVAVVTSIGLDHQEYLGNTRESVGFEKAGILRPSIKLVCSEIDLPSTFVAEVGRQQALMLQRNKDYGWRAEGEHWLLYGRDARGESRSVTGLPAVSLPKDNLVTALQAFWAAGLELADKQIVDALANVRVPGRMQRRTVSWRGQPRQLLLDVGHNPHAAAFLAAELESDRLERLAVFGLLADKDLAGVVAPLVGVFSRWALAPLPSPRTRPVSDLATCLTVLGERSEGYGSVAEALEQSLDTTPASTEIVIFGSFFCVSAAILWLNLQSRDLNNG